MFYKNEKDSIQADLTFKDTNNNENIREQARLASRNIKTCRSQCEPITLLSK